MAADGRRRFGALRGLAATLRDPAVRRPLWVAVFVIVGGLLFASVGLSQEVNLRAGQVARFTIKAPRDMVDRPTTQGLRQAAADKVATVYRTDTAVTQDALSAYDSGIRTIESARTSLAATPARPAATAPSKSSSAASGSTAAAASSGKATQLAAVASLRRRLHLPVSGADYTAVLQAPGTTLGAASAEARSRLAQLLQAGVRASQRAADRAQLQNDVLSQSAPGPVNRVLAALATQSLVANRFPDASATAAARAAAAAKVTPVVIGRGQVIVRAGDRVSKDEISVLRDAGLLHPGGTLGLLAGSLLLAMLFSGLSWAFLAQFRPQTLAHEMELVLFGSVLLAALGAVRLGAQLSAFLAPVPWAAMLAAVAFGPAVGVFVGGLGGVVAGLLDHNLAVGACAAAASWTAAFAVRRVAARADLLRGGLHAAWVGVVSAGVLSGLLLGGGVNGSGLFGGGSTPLPWDMVAAGFTGLLSGVLAIGTLPYAEALGVLTPFKLLELANPGQPLLRRLMVEAPGTYHHSLMVANLSEAACQAIGGDALLARVGAYYHDIGKMKRPAFFVENQMGGQNPHDKLTPQMSALVIVSHTRDGVEMARQARLPREIVAFIRSHHGTTLVRYFYHQAQRAAEQAGAEAIAVREEDFRYDGPLPDTRETAVVMLADGVEAAVRALAHPNSDAIEDTIRRLLDERLQEGQLEQVPLTLKDMETIRSTFRAILVGAYHARIVYPDAGGPGQKPPSQEVVAASQPVSGPGVGRLALRPGPLLRRPRKGGSPPPRAAERG